ncbi:DNA polymerase III subunit delta' [soil metagenome]
MNETIAAPLWGVWGNEAAVERMQRAARMGPRHAYIISGPASTGKSRLASSFASALICPHTSGAGEGCGSCSTCRRVAKGVHPDVARFDLAYQAVRDEGKSKNLSLNISTVREIGRQVSLRPSESSWRVVIVDDVETMQEPAQEAFLKTLEEPPSYVVILLLTSDADLLLPTVRSRCSMVTMTPVPDAVVANALLARGASQDEAALLAVATRGCIGVALMALEDDNRKAVLLDSLHLATSWIAADRYSRMVRAVQLADRFSDARDGVYEQLLSAEVAWRELVLRAADAGRVNSHPVTSTCRLPTMEGGYRALAAINQCLRDLDANVRPRAALEMMVLQWPDIQTGMST